MSVLRVEVWKSTGWCSFAADGSVKVHRVLNRIMGPSTELTDHRVVTPFSALRCCHVVGVLAM